ncbi:MAG TPA: tryptophan synthase subunit alpha [Vicinamibacterales bacterium]|nr:tryptophan synthase subunit alpha [Vicinamibacterales bacterium]
MSSRLDPTFAHLRSNGGRGLIAYVTAGDPSLDQTAAMLPALCEAGADVLEIGVPFSDPLADGPVIQRASERALAAGTTLRRTLQLVRDVRDRVAAPMVLFTYANPIVRMGEAAFARAAADAGVDGVLVLDLPIEEADAFRQQLVDAGLDPIFLLSPTTTDERIDRAAALGRGFLYVISRLGVTGARDRLSDAAAPLIERIRRRTDMPIALGFGISRPEHVTEATTWADAAVVGSGLVNVIAEHARSADLPRQAAAYVRWLKNG